MKFPRAVHVLPFLLGLVLVAPRGEAAAASWKTALVAQTDPAKLARLKDRQANPRVNRIIYYLHEAQAAGTEPGAALDQAFSRNGTVGPAAALSRKTLLLNYRHAMDWGLFTDSNLHALRRGHAATITRGSYKGKTIDIDHIVPLSLASETGCSLANLEMQPMSVNRSKGARVGLYELRFASRLYEAGILHKATLWRVRWAFATDHVLPWLVLAGALFFYRRRRRRTTRSPVA